MQFVVIGGRRAALALAVPSQIRLDAVEDLDQVDDRFAVARECGSQRDVVMAWFADFGSAGSGEFFRDMPPLSDG